MDVLWLNLIKDGGVSGALIALALAYLGFQVRSLKDAVNSVNNTIGEKVFPRLDDLQGRVSRIEGQMESQSKVH